VDYGADKYMDIIERDIFSIICRNDGIKAKSIAKELGKERSIVNRYLYRSAFMRDLCYRDDNYMWRGLIRQTRPHTGLSDYCGYYGIVDDFLKISKDEWFEYMKSGCMSIGRNLNDTRGLFHSFSDTHDVMVNLFGDLDGIDYSGWEIVFELRIKKSKHIRIYADVLVITDRYVFSFEFKMNDEIIDNDVLQAAKYNEYLEVLFGPEYEVISALVLTRASDLYTYVPVGCSTAEIAVCSGDMLFNVFNEYLGFFL